MNNLYFINLALSLTITACGNKNSGLENNAVSHSKPPSDAHAELTIASDSNLTGCVFTPVASMHKARASHTATLLKNGTVLICGGFAGSSGNSLSSAEIYDPASKSFVQISQLNTPRSTHTATLLPNGKVLIAGGYNRNSLSSTEIFDPELKSFTEGPKMNTARYGHTATLLNNGRILFAGGVGTGWTFLSSAEIYDTQTNTFMPANPLMVARESHTATLLQNGNVLIAGGHVDRRENLQVYASSEIYDTKSDQFSATGSMNIARHKHSAVLLSDGKVLINGGADKNDTPYTSAEVYDPGTFQFTPIASMNYPRYKHNGMSVDIHDNHVIILGGSDKAEVYNSNTGRFTPIQGELGPTRMFACATKLQSGDVLITGGYDEHISAISESILFEVAKRK